jgi:hypothetical protein
MLLMVSSTDHIAGVAGATLTLTASKAGGAFGSISPTVVDRGNGWYSVALTGAHLDTLGDFALHATAASCDPSDPLIEVVAYDPGDAAGLGLSRVDTTVGSRLATTGYTAPDNAGISSINGRLPSDPADESALEAAIAAVDVPTVVDIVAGILAAQYTGTKTLQSLLVLLRAHAAGVSTGFPAHPIFAAPDGTTPVLEADVDADGNRSAVDAHGG